MTLSHALAKYSLTRLTGSLPFSGHKPFPIATAMSAARRPLLQLPSNSGAAAAAFIRNAKIPYT